MTSAHDFIEIVHDKDEWGPYICITTGRPVPRWSIYTENATGLPAPMMMLDGESYIINWIESHDFWVSYYLIPCPDGAQTHGVCWVNHEAIHEAWEEQSKLRKYNRFGKWYLMIPLELLVGSLPTRWVCRCADHVPIDPDRAAFLTSIPFAALASLSFLLMITGAGFLYFYLALYSLAEVALRAGGYLVGLQPLGLLPLELLDRIFARLFLGVSFGKDYNVAAEDLEGEASLARVAQQDYETVQGAVRRFRTQHNIKKKSASGIIIEEKATNDGPELHVTTYRPIPHWDVYTGNLGDRSPTVMYCDHAYFISDLIIDGEGHHYVLQSYRDEVYTSGTVYLDEASIQSRWEEEDNLDKLNYWHKGWPTIPLEILFSFFPARMQHSFSRRFPVDTRRGAIITAFPLTVAGLVLIINSGMNAVLEDTDTTGTDFYVGVFILTESVLRLLILVINDDTIGWLPVEYLDRLLSAFRKSSK